MMHPYRENARSESSRRRAIPRRPFSLLIAGVLVLCGASVTLVSLFIRLLEFANGDRSSQQTRVGLESLSSLVRRGGGGQLFDQGAAFRSIVDARERAHALCIIEPSAVGTASAMTATVTFNPLTGEASSVEIDEKSDSQVSQHVRGCFQRILEQTHVPPFWSDQQTVIVNLHREHPDTCFPTDRLPNLILIPSRVSFGPRVHDNARSDHHGERVIHPVHEDADDIRALRKYLLREPKPFASK